MTGRRCGIRFTGWHVSGVHTIHIGRVRLSPPDLITWFVTCPVQLKGSY